MALNIDLRVGSDCLAVQATFHRFWQASLADALPATLNIKEYWSSRRMPVVATLLVLSGGPCLTLELHKSNSSRAVSVSLTNLHTKCSHDNTAAVCTIVDGCNLVLAPIPTGKQQAVFWGFCLGAGALQLGATFLEASRIPVVFDLDETLLVAYSLHTLDVRLAKLYEGRSNSEKGRADQVEADHLTQDRVMLHQFAEQDQVVVRRPNGSRAVFKARFEEVLPEDGGKPLARPVVRIPELGLVFSRIVADLPHTSLIMHVRPGWEALFQALCPESSPNVPGQYSAKQRFEVYVCTAAERGYALEAWRILDPKGLLIGDAQRRNRIIAGKRKKSLADVLHLGSLLDRSGDIELCKDPRLSLDHSLNNSEMPLAVVLDDRLEVWDHKAQAQLLQVQPFMPRQPAASEGNPAAEMERIKGALVDLRSRLYYGINEILTPAVQSLSTALAKPGASVQDSSLLPTVPRVASILRAIDLAPTRLVPQRSAPQSASKPGTAAENLAALHSPEPPSKTRVTTSLLPLDPRRATGTSAASGGVLGKRSAAAAAAPPLQQSASQLQQPDAATIVLSATAQQQLSSKRSNLVSRTATKENRRASEDDEPPPRKRSHRSAAEEVSSETTQSAVSSLLTARQPKATASPPGLIPQSDVTSPSTMPHPIQSSSFPPGKPFVDSAGAANADSAATDAAAAATATIANSKSAAASLQRLWFGAQSQQPAAPSKPPSPHPVASQPPGLLPDGPDASSSKPVADLSEQLQPSGSKLVSKPEPAVTAVTKERRVPASKLDSNSESAAASGKAARRGLHDTSEEASEAAELESLMAQLPRVAAPHQVNAVKSLLSVTPIHERHIFIKQLQEEVAGVAAAGRTAPSPPLPTPQFQLQPPEVRALRGGLFTAINDVSALPPRRPVAKPMATSASATSTVSTQQRGLPGLPPGSLSRQQPTGQGSQGGDRQSTKIGGYPARGGATIATPATGVQLLEQLLQKMPVATVAHYDDHIQVLRRLLLPLSSSDAAPLVQQLEEVLSAPLLAAADSTGPADSRTAGSSQNGTRKSTSGAANGSHQVSHQKPRSDTKQNKQPPWSTDDEVALSASAGQHRGQLSRKKGSGNRVKPMPALKTNFFTSPNILAASQPKAYSKQSSAGQAGKGSNGGPTINGSSAPACQRLPSTTLTRTTTEAHGLDPSDKRPSAMTSPQSRQWLPPAHPQSDSASQMSRDDVSLRNTAGKPAAIKQRKTPTKLDHDRTSVSTKQQSFWHGRSKEGSLPGAEPSSPTHQPVYSHQQQQRKHSRVSGKSATHAASSVPVAVTGLARAKEVAASLVSSTGPGQQSGAPEAVQLQEDPRSTSTLPNSQVNPAIPGIARPRQPCRQQPLDCPPVQPAEHSADLWQHQRHRASQNTKILSSQGLLPQHEGRTLQRRSPPAIPPASTPLQSSATLVNEASLQGGPPSQHAPSDPQPPPETGNVDWNGVDSSADWEPPTWAVFGNVAPQGAPSLPLPHRPQPPPHPPPPSLLKSSAQPQCLPPWGQLPTGTQASQLGGPPATPTLLGSRMVRGNDQPPGSPTAGPPPRAYFYAAAKPFELIDAELAVPRCAASLLVSILRSRQMVLGCSEAVTKDQGGSGPDKMHLCQLWLCQREIGRGNSATRFAARSAAAEGALEHLQLFQWHIPDRPPCTIPLSVKCTAPRLQDVEDACIQAAKCAVGGGRVTVSVYDTRRLRYSTRHAAEVQLELFDCGGRAVATVGGWGTNSSPQRQAVLMAIHMLVRYLWVDAEMKAAFQTALRRALEPNNLMSRFQKTAMQIHALIGHVPGVPPLVVI